MNKLFKFFLRKNNIETKKLDVDERIGYLANELIKELKASGRDISLPDIDDGYGNFGIYVHNLGNDNEKIIISNLINDWEIKIKPTFGEF